MRTVFRVSKKIVLVLSFKSSLGSVLSYISVGGACVFLASAADFSFGLDASRIIRMKSPMLFSRFCRKFFHELFVFATSLCLICCAEKILRSFITYQWMLKMPRVHFVLRGH